MIMTFKRDDGDWECPECGMTYRPIEDKSNACLCSEHPEAVDWYYTLSTKLLNSLIK